MWLPFFDPVQRTAIITGASAGIGAEYARQLAAQGYDLLLVARREERLRQLADELGEKWSVSAEVHPTDLANPDQTNQLATLIDTHPSLSLLINNAGFGTMERIADADNDAQLAMLHLHVNATYLLSRAAVRNMLPHKQGAIINVSSIAGYFHGSGSANYCATKAYITSFSQSLAKEVRDAGLVVQALCPGYTVTEFHDTLDKFDRSQVPKPLWMTAKEVVKISLDALKKKQVVVIPGRRNQLLVAGSTPLGKLRGLMRRFRPKRKM